MSYKVLYLSHYAKIKFSGIYPSDQYGCGVVKVKKVEFSSDFILDEVIQHIRTPSKPLPSKRQATQKMCSDTRGKSCFHGKTASELNRPHKKAILQTSAEHKRFNSRSPTKVSREGRQKWLTGVVSLPFSYTINMTDLWPKNLAKCTAFWFRRFPKQMTFLNS